MTEEKFIVIGSGPAAIAATHALVELGHVVTILDIGRRIEPERQKLIDRLASQEPPEWSERDLIAAKGEISNDKTAFNSKKFFGSSFSFNKGSSDVAVRWKKGEGFQHSSARGGLSNVWGAALLPYLQEDIRDWPIAVKDLADHYRAVTAFVPNTAVKDGLEEVLPSYSNQDNPLEPSRQGAALLNDLNRQKSALESRGLHYGRSRLAIYASANEYARDCAYCNLCLSGCPYGLIYTSAHTLEDLIATGKVTYLDRHIVEKVEDLGNRVIVSGRILGEDHPFSMQSQRVFLGAGLLPTTKIVLDSLGCFDHPIRAMDSQYFIYPLFRFRNTGGVETERMHTSSQAFIEISDPGVSKHLVHLQVYGFSSFLLRELENTILRWPLRIPAFRRHFLGRLLIVQGFIHSRESGSIDLTLVRSDDSKSVLSAKTNASAKAFFTVLKVGGKLLRSALELGAIPLIPALKFPKPGSSYHSGGTFPMKAFPKEHETDSLGRLPAMQRVHIVDSSVLPSIPATSITLSVMANAHRIATKAAKLDDL